MSKDSKKKKASVKDSDFIEFVLEDELASSAEFVIPPATDNGPLSLTLEPDSKLEDMPPAFRELALPKLPELGHQNRARLLMQSPNRLFFYWSLGSNPFQKLNQALGAETAGYTLVLKLVDLKRDLERIHAADADGSWWFDVEADGEYRAEIGFYAPNRPYVRAVFSNTIQTPRNSPSPRADTEADWSISADRFARVLEVAGFTEDAFDVALAGDDPASAQSATHAAFADLIDTPDFDFDGLSADEVRHAMLLLASGLALDGLRFKVSPSVFSALQERSDSLSSEKALAALKKRFDIEGDEIVEEEFGSAVFGASLVNFPRRLKTRRTLPKLNPITSPGRNHVQ